MTHSKSPHQKHFVLALQPHEASHHGKTAWSPVISCSVMLLLLMGLAIPYSATGGAITTDGLYTVHTFTSNGTFNVTGTISSATVLVVAGGGAGAAYAGGGGGAGGLIYNTSYTATGNITVIVGLGGVGQTHDGGVPAKANSGTDSAFGSLTAIGGGGGGTDQASPPVFGGNGGSGGGGGGLGIGTTYGGNGTIGQGNAGGGNSGVTSAPYPTGGGGGAFSGGDNATTGVSGNGGTGLNYTINGSTVCYSGGGGGGIYGAGTSGTASCGGGAGSTEANKGGDAANGTGGGGGGTGIGGIAGFGGSGIVIVRYLTYVEPPVFISQVPADISSLNIVNAPLQISYNLSSSEPVNVSNVRLYYKTNSTFNDISSYHNGTADMGWEYDIAGTNISSIWNWSMGDNEVYPHTENIQDSIFRNMGRNITTLVSNSDYFMTQYLNVSNTTQYGFYEQMFNSSTATGVRVYACNNASGTPNNPNSNANCVQLASKVANGAYDHMHNMSGHMVIPFTINTTTGTIAGSTVKVTPTMYFLIRGNNGANVRVYQINQQARVGATKTTTNNGNAWTNRAYTTDGHLHQYTGNESFWYYACANQDTDCSEVRQDLISLAGLPPTAPAIITPTENSFGMTNISYDQAISPNNYPITHYVIALMNPDGSINETITANNSVNLSYMWNAATVPYAQYYIRVTAVDNQSQSTSARSDLLYFGNWTFAITSISVPAAVDPVSCTTAAIPTIQVNVTNTNGYANVNVANTHVNITRGSVVKQTTNCVADSNGVDWIVINCTGASMNFYDVASSDWQLTAYTNSTENYSVTGISATNMTYNEGTHMRINNAPIAFGTLYSGTTNAVNTNSPTFNIQNCGNTNLNMTITGVNLTDSGSNYIPVNSFRVDDDLTPSEGTETGLSELTLSEAAQNYSKVGGHPFGASETRDLWFFANVPVGQAQATYNTGVWTFTASKAL